MRFQILAEPVNDKDPYYRSKMHSNDRALVLKRIDESKSPGTTTGIVDNRLFTNENTLRAVRDPVNSLWRLRYKTGLLPGPLKQKFTSFSELMRFAEAYFKKRNMKIVEVVDFDDEN